MLENRNNDEYISTDEKNQLYIDKKHGENIKIINDIKDKAKKYAFRNGSLDEFIKAKYDYIKILEDATREMTLLEIEMHDPQEEL